MNDERSGVKSGMSKHVGAAGPTRVSLVGPAGTQSSSGPVGATGATGATGSNSENRIRVFELSQIPSRHDAHLTLNYDERERVIYGTVHVRSRHGPIVHTHSGGGYSRATDILIFDGSLSVEALPSNTGQWISAESTDMDKEKLSSAEAVALRVLNRSKWSSEALGHSGIEEIIADFKNLRYDPCWQLIIDEAKSTFEVCRVMMT